MQSANVQEQFGKRADTFNKSANWINDSRLIEAHVKMAGNEGVVGSGLELCCGTGIIGKAFFDKGWNMTGVDLTKEMVIQANQHFPAIQGNVEELCFESDSFDLVVMRQALFFLNVDQTFKEIKRVLKRNGIFILSQTVPFSDEDCEWLKKIHIYKQEQMLQFYTDRDLERELTEHGLAVVQKEYLRIRESIRLWMEHAPEQNLEKKNQVCRFISEAPEGYKRVRNVKVVNNELFEDWNWIILKAVNNAK